MNLGSANLMVVAACILTIAAGAVASGVMSSAGLIALIGVALLPLSPMLARWPHPAHRMSETIQPVRR